MSGITCGKLLMAKNATLLDASGCNWGASAWGFFLYIKDAFFMSVLILSKRISCKFRKNCFA